MWVYNPHQIEGAEWALAKIREKTWAYLSWQERTRKTGTALLTVENSLADTCLIVTKKRAMDGWQEHLANLPLTKKYTLINYESIHTIKGSFDFIILDEAHHAISGKPKKSKVWSKVAKFTKKKPILYLSATPYAENLGLVFHQLALSSWSPFSQTNFYRWFEVYGIPHKVRTPYGLSETYSKYKDDIILDIIQPYFDFKTRKSVGIEHEPTVNLVRVPLLETTIQVIEQTIKDEMFIAGDIEIPLDSPMKLRMTHYQLEGGTLKVDDTKSIFTTSGREKIEYIRANYDLDNLAIMAHFIAERKLLEAEFPNVPIYSADGHAEGVDLSHIAKLLIYSMSFKTSKYTQRLARQANHDRKTPIEVDILVGDKPAIGYDVFNTVAIKKENFDKNSYDRVWS